MSPYTPKLANYHKKCSDPFKIHKKIITKSLRRISKSAAVKFLEVKLKEGESICTACLDRLNKKKQSAPTLSSESEYDVAIRSDSVDSDLEPDVKRAELNLQLANLNVTPIKCKFCCYIYTFTSFTVK